MIINVTAKQCNSLRTSFHKAILWRLILSNGKSNVPIAIKLRKQNMHMQ